MYDSNKSVFANIHFNGMTTKRTRSKSCWKLVGAGLDRCFVCYPTFRKYFVRQNAQSTFNNVPFWQIVDIHELGLCTCLPNDLMLNQWLTKKNNFSVYQFRIRGAKNVDNEYCIYIKEINLKSGNVMP